MTQVTLPGNYTSALTHLAGYGLAAICEAQGLTRVRLGWTDAPMPSQYVEVQASETEIAEAVLTHAQRAAHDSWLTSQLDGEPWNGSATFSPRIKPAKTVQQWQNHQQVRNAVLDKLTDQSAHLDLEMIAGLGEPAHWSGDGQPDQGASRWEMKTRNKGEEFVRHRFLPLAQAVAGRNAASVAASLSGAHLVNELKVDRISTGLTPPGPCDTVLAWCGLWGIASLPTLSHRGIGISPGVYPKRITYPRFAVLPVRPARSTLAYVRDCLQTRQFDAAAQAAVKSSPGEDPGREALDRVAAEVGREWLRERGFAALVVFPFHMSQGKAPERSLLPGRAVPLS